MNTVGCGGCEVRWHQRGNSTGHCSGCHRTFDSLAAFDRHQTIRHGRNLCHDPAAVTNRDGSDTYQSRTDDLGVTYWRLRPTEQQAQWLASKHP